MNNVRYFKVPLSSYEAIRKDLDKKVGFPNLESSTCIVPGSDIPKDIIDKDCLISTSSLLIISEFSGCSDAVEISKEAYEFLLQEIYN